MQPHNIEQKSREAEILDLLSKMSGVFNELTNLWEAATTEYRDTINFIEEEYEYQTKFIRLARLLYNCIIVYLESDNRAHYLAQFKKQFDPIFESDKELLKEYYHNEIGEVFSEALDKLWTFLHPFQFSRSAYERLVIHQAGLQYLENILQSTQSILLQIGAKPKSEPQLYTYVKYVVSTVFPSSKDAGSYFAKCFKQYKPDVLIPELKTAVEYKYAKTETDLTNQMGQIAEDTVAYSGDYDYETFYAVFYVVDDFWSVPKFKQAWKDMKFPENWKGVYIVGKLYE